MNTISYYDVDDACITLNVIFIQSNYTKELRLHPSGIQHWDKNISKLKYTLRIIPVKHDNYHAFYLILPNRQPLHFDTNDTIRNLKNLTNNICRMCTHQSIDTQIAFNNATKSMIEYWQKHIKGNHFNQHDWDIYSDKFKLCFGQYPTIENNEDIINILHYTNIMN